MTELFGSVAMDLARSFEIGRHRGLAFGLVLGVVLKGPSVSLVCVSHPPTLGLCGVACVLVFVCASPCWLLLFC